MSRLNWNVPEGRFFDTGLDRGVLYPKGTPPLGPIIATNLAHDPSFEQVGVVSAIETNLVLNPSFNGTVGVGVAPQWNADGPSGTTGTLTRSIVASPGVTAGGTAQRIHCLAMDNAGATYAGVSTASINISGATRVYVRIHGTAVSMPLGRTMAMHVQFLNASNVVLSSPSVIRNTTGVLELQLQPPAGTTQAIIYARVQGTAEGSPTPAAVEAIFDACLLATVHGPVAYFDGSTTAADDFTYAWAGTAHASASTRRVTLVGGRSGGAAIAMSSTNWKSTGARSMRVYSQYHVNGSAYVDIEDFAPGWGKTYTVKVKVRVREQLPHQPGIIALTTGLTPAFNASTYVPKTNGVVAPGVYDLSMTFSWPQFAAGAAKYLRLYNANAYGTSVWFDDLLVVEGVGKDLNGDPVTYFSGDTEDTGAHEYFWDAAPTSFKPSYKRQLLTLAVPWIGLQSVDEEGGDSAAAYYIDGRPFLFLPRPKEYKASLKAMTYPDAFAEIMGVQEVADGMYLDSQPGSSFDLSYRTLVGNAIDGIDHGYKIHLVYNATVAPQALTYESMSNSINPTAFSWEIQAVPVPVEGFRPTAHIIIDTRHMSQAKIDAVEELIYGSENEVATMPSPQAIFDLLSFGDTIVVTDNGDGTFDVTGSYENVYMVGDGLFRVDNVDGQDNGDGTFTISTTLE